MTSQSVKYNSVKPLTVKCHYNIVAVNTVKLDAERIFSFISKLYITWKYILKNSKNSSMCIDDKHGTENSDLFIL